MTTIRDVVSRSLRLIEEVGAGESASGDMANDAMVSLISMVDSWSIQNKLVFTETRESFTLTSDISSYTIGTGGDFSTTRPIKISSAFIRIDNIDYPLSVIGNDEYASIPDKSLLGMPTHIYYDGNYPLGNIILYPAPHSAYSLHIYSTKPLSNFSSLDDVLSMPNGYERALVYNLAIEIAPEYGKQASMTVLKIAGESKKAIESANSLNDTPQLIVDETLTLQGRVNSIYDI